jgi:hypothetical protein
MHTYYRKTGRWIAPDGKLLGICIAGLDDGDGVLEPGEGLNDPSMEKVKGVGPLPAGLYRLGRPFTHPTAGPFTMRLEPLPGTKLYDRSGFLFHGGRKTAPGVSHGCVVGDRPVREAANAYADRLVQVV